METGKYYLLIGLVLYIAFILGAVLSDQANKNSVRNAVEHQYTK